MSGLQRSLVGTWKMVEGTARDAQGRARSAPYGPRAMGLLTLNAEGRMMAVLCDGRSALAEGTRRDYSSYCGNYVFDGATLTTDVDASGTARVVIGGQQVRQVRFEGEFMILVPPPVEIDGVLEYREVRWQRLSAEPA